MRRHNKQIQITGACAILIQFAIIQISWYPQSLNRLVCPPFPGDMWVFCKMIGVCRPLFDLIQSSGTFPFHKSCQRCPAHDHRLFLKLFPSFELKTHLISVLLWWFLLPFIDKMVPILTRSDLRRNRCTNSVYKRRKRKPMMLLFLLVRRKQKG